MWLQHWPNSTFPWSEINIELSKEWGSNSEQHRELLAEAETRVKALMKSRSHSIALGGFAWTSSNQILGLGFDVEQVSRALPQVSTRIARTHIERDLALRKSALFWTAKEASFKALKNFRQPKVVSQVEISSWKNFSSHYESFEVSNAGMFDSPRLQGLSWTVDDFAFSVVVTLSARP